MYTERLFIGRLNERSASSILFHLFLFLLVFLELLRFVPRTLALLHTEIAAAFAPLLAAFHYSAAAAAAQEYRDPHDRRNSVICFAFFLAAEVIDSALFSVTIVDVHPIVVI